MNTEKTIIGYLDNFHFEKNVDDLYDNQLKLKIVNDDKTFNIIFTNVQDLKIGNLTSHLVLVILIRNISSHQLENLSFFISEEEYNTFSFYCKSFSVYE